MWIDFDILLIELCTRIHTNELKHLLTSHTLKLGYVISLYKDNQLCLIQYINTIHHVFCLTDLQILYEQIIVEFIHVNYKIVEIDPVYKSLTISCQIDSCRIKSQVWQDVEIIPVCSNICRSKS